MLSELVKMAEEQLHKQSDEIVEAIVRSAKRQIIRNAVRELTWNIQNNVSEIPHYNGRR